MKDKKLGFWKKMMSLVLSFMLLMPSTVFAKDMEDLSDVSGTEIVQVDLNAELEKALQENSMLESKAVDETRVLPDIDEDIESENEEPKLDEDDIDKPDNAEENLEVEDSLMEISPRGVSMPVTELYIYRVKGVSDGETKTEEIKNCGQGLHIASNASAEAKTVFDRAELRISVQYIGTFLQRQKQTATGDIYMTNSAPYN